jgi:hypothetical protein
VCSVERGVGKRFSVLCVLSALTLRKMREHRETVCVDTPPNDEKKVRKEMLRMSPINTTAQHNDISFLLFFHWPLCFVSDVSVDGSGAQKDT